MLYHDYADATMVLEFLGLLEEDRGSNPKGMFDMDLVERLG